jgi:hypothetical protein
MATMETTKFVILTFISAIVFVACSELVHTQVEGPELIVDNNTLLADGQSRTVFRLHFRDQLSVQQQVYVTTTNGKLYSGPLSFSSTGMTDTIILNPGARDAMFYLESTNIPDDQVLVTATVNGMQRSQVIDFARSCPDEVKIELDKDSIELNASDSIHVKFTLLRDDGKNVSSLTRIDATISEQGRVAHTLYADDAGIAHAYIKARSTGEGTATFVLKTPCSATITPVTFKIYEE